MDEIKQSRTCMPTDSENLKISDQFDMMEVDEEFVFYGYRLIAEEEEIEIDVVSHLGDLQIRDQFDIMKMDERLSSENYESID